MSGATRDPTRQRLPGPRGRWACIVLLTFGGCGLPSYADYSQLQNVRLADAGNAGSGSEAGPSDAGGGDAGPVSDAAADACDSSNCSTPSCTPGLGDCNGSPDDGCETTLDSEAHCGGCGVECVNSHGTTTCAGAAPTGYACAPSCAPGFADCDLDPSNGCETNLNTDSTHCGSCDLACPANGGTPRCQAGECGISTCNPGFGDCQNIGACLQNLNSDVNNCGHCGHVCSNAHGTPSCNGGSCQIDCEAGWGDCNDSTTDAGAPPDDGCETKLNIADSNGNVPNCGACGARCGRRAFTNVNLAQCALGVCSRDCFSGAVDCGENRNDPSCNGSGCGCEYTGGDGNNCGACGHVCKGGACSGGKCECPDTQPKSGTTTCALASTVKCGTYGTSCTCSCAAGVFKCTDAAGKAC